MPRAEDYQHLPIEYASLSWYESSKGSDPLYTKPLALDLAIHPNRSGRIIINYPGWRGDREGFNRKHQKLAQYMQGESLGAVVRGKGPGHPDFGGFPLDTQLRKMINFSIGNSKQICGAEEPELLLIGTSAGGSAVAATGTRYEWVKRILLMAPSGDVDKNEIKKGMGAFNGEVYVVIGENDDVVGGRESGEYFESLAVNATRRELFVLPDCNHQFHGEVNGRYMSQAPFYAFTKGKRPSFPDPNGGMILY